MATKKKLLVSAAGAADGAGGLNVEDVFSTYLYEGNGTSSHTITNGVDYTAEDYLVWIKDREYAGGGGEWHQLYDTVRGATKILASNSTGAEYTESYGLKTFNSDGFTLGQSNAVNRSGSDIVAWTFRKAPKFFDVVTYTGTGSAQNISHNLGSVPGMVVVKNITTGGANSNWTVWHNSLSDDSKFLRLNTTDAEATASNQFNGTAPTSTVFSVGTSSNTNASGDTFVAYLFAHNNGDGEFGPDGDADIIKCGSYTGNGSATGPEIDLGFEPQWVMIKNPDYSGAGWSIWDNMRGVTTGGNDQRLYANTSGAEGTSGGDDIYFTSTGFGIGVDYQYLNNSGDNIIYIAIRRGPMAVPTDAAEVFAVDAGNSPTSTAPEYTSNFPVDMAFYRDVTGTMDTRLSSRLTGNKYLRTNLTNAETGLAGVEFDYMDGYFNGALGSNYYAWMWSRAPSFFDVVAYTGNGTAGRTVSHNLGVAPEMMWVKSRDAAYDWRVYHSSTGATKSLELNNSVAAATNSYIWNDTAPTDSVFSLGTHTNVNKSGDDYIAYLFASLDGVSKVGSVSHTTGSNTDVDCGFSAGARFVLTKRSNDTGHWLIADTERGIVAGNDPYLLLSSTLSQITNGDVVDPYSSGFSLGPTLATGTWIYYAIA